MADWYNQQPRNNNQLMATPVQGEEAAQNYLVAAGCTVLLIDLNSAKKHIWLKSNDANGLIQTMRTFEVNEITPKPKPDQNFINREEFENFQQDVKSQLLQMVSILTELGGIKNEPTNTEPAKQPKTPAAEVQ